MAESEQGSSSSMTSSRQEEDEMLNQIEEDKRLLDESDGEEKQTTTDQKEKAADAVHVSSVGTLAKNFMKNVRVGSNDVFVAPATHPANKTVKSASSRGTAAACTEQGSGLARGYEMVKAARRNWMSAVALSGIGPLSRKVAVAGGGLKLGVLWSTPTTATLLYRISTA